MSDEKTYRSVGMAKIDDNFRISLNIKWLGQIIVGVGILVMGYLRIENRIGELERRVELADTNIEDAPIRLPPIDANLLNSSKASICGAGFRLIFFIISFCFSSRVCGRL